MTNNQNNQNFKFPKFDENNNLKNCFLDRNEYIDLEKCFQKRRTFEEIFNKKLENNQNRPKFENVFPDLPIDNTPPPKSIIQKVLEVTIKICDTIADLADRSGLSKILGLLHDVNLTSFWLDIPTEDEKKDEKTEDEKKDEKPKGGKTEGGKTEGGKTEGEELPPVPQQISMAFDLYFKLIYKAFVFIVEKIKGLKTDLPRKEQFGFQDPCISI